MHLFLLLIAANIILINTEEKPYTTVKTIFDNIVATTEYFEHTPRNITVLEEKPIPMDNKILEDDGYGITKNVTTEETPLADMIEHRSVIENINFYTYVVSILEKDKFLCAGALIRDDWVITAADALYFKRDFSRFLRVRLGSSNYKKRGVVAPVKYVEVHPYFDDTTPEYDVALVKLAKAVKRSDSVSSIKIQGINNDIATTHFILTSWKVARPLKNKHSMPPENISHKGCLLKMTHIHPMIEVECQKYLSHIKINSTDNLMCLESDMPCLREIGAPVVLDRTLWGVVSSYVDEECNRTENPPPMLVTKTFSPKVYSWIRSVTFGEAWNPELDKDYNSAVDLDYTDKVFN